ILQIEKLIADLDALGTGETGPGVIDHGPRWFLHFSGVKSRSTEAAIAAVDQVLRASGGSHYFRRSELERLSRDVRAGMYHPSDDLGAAQRHQAADATGVDEVHGRGAEPGGEYPVVADRLAAALDVSQHGGTRLDAQPLLDQRGQHLGDPAEAGSAELVEVVVH